MPIGEFLLLIEIKKRGTRSVQKNIVVHVTFKSNNLDEKKIKLKKNRILF